MKPDPKKTKTANKTDKRTRGYRLKPSTHMLILKIQKMMKSDQDEAIAGACNMYYKELKKIDPAKDIKNIIKENL